MNPAPFVDIGLNNPVYDSVNIGKKYQKSENKADDVKPTHGNKTGDQVTMESNKIDGKKYQKFENEADDVKPMHGNKTGDQVTMESNKFDGKKYQKFENEADDVKPTHGNEAGDQVTMESNKIDDSGLDNPLYKEVQNAFDMDDDF